MRPERGECYESYAGTIKRRAVPSDRAGEADADTAASGDTMRTMRILITGGEGQFSRALEHSLRSHDVIALSHAQLDVADASSFDAKVAAHSPEIVIHTAALTDTTRCEREPHVAELINARGTENAAEACRRHSAKLIAISTNEVFDGTKREPYIENDEPKAINAYGRSKLLGEEYARRTLPGKESIVRTSWVYGDGTNNYVAKVLAAARAGRPLRFATDEIAAPTSTHDLADAISKLVGRDRPPGIYHLSNSGEASRYEWAREIIRLAGIDAAVTAVTTDELRAEGYAGPRKPAYSTLANTRAAALGITLRPWREALAAQFERANVGG